MPDPIAIVITDNTAIVKSVATQIPLQVSPTELDDLSATGITANYLPLADGTGGITWGVVPTHTHTSSQVSDSTAVGRALVTLANPSAITFLRVNANNTVSTLSAADFLTAIGAAASVHTHTVSQISDSGATGQALVQAATAAAAQTTLGLIGYGARNVSAILTGDETGNENTATLKTSAVSVALEAGTWDVEALGIVNCNNTGAGSRQKLHFTGTASSFTGVVYGTDNGTTLSSGFPGTRAAGVAPDYERVASGSSSATYRVGRIVVTVAGDLVWQYAQRTATPATSPTLVAGTFIRAIRVA